MRRISVLGIALGLFFGFQLVQLLAFLVFPRFGLDPEDLYHFRVGDWYVIYVLGSSLVFAFFVNRFFVRRRERRSERDARRSRRRTILLVGLIGIAAINLYYGSPIYVGQEQTFKKFYGEDIESVVNGLRLRSIAGETAEGLARRGASFGSIRDVPKMIQVEKLGHKEALVNIWTAVSMSVAFALGAIWLGIAVLFYSILAGSVKYFLLSAVMIILYPVVCLCMPGMLLLALTFADAAVGYNALLYPLLIVAWIPTIILSLVVLLLAVQGIVGAISADGSAADFKIQLLDDGTPLGEFISNMGISKLSIFGWLK